MHLSPTSKLGYLSFKTDLCRYHMSHPTSNCYIPLINYLNIQITIHNKSKTFMCHMCKNFYDIVVSFIFTVVI